MQAGAHQVVEILVDQPVGADQLRDFLLGAAGGDQLGRRRHVDAIHVREAHRRRGGGEVHLLAPASRARSMICAEVVPRTMESSTSSTFLPRNSRSMAFSLRAHRFLALLLPRHDERAADVAVLDEAFAIFHAELLRDLQGARAAGVRNRDDDVDVVIRPMRRIFSASLSPMRMRALCTEMLSMIESGRAKYTYSKMHGVWRAAGTHCCEWNRPCSSMNTASPGPTSRTNLKPSCRARRFPKRASTRRPAASRAGRAPAGGCRSDRGSRACRGRRSSPRRHNRRGSGDTRH